MSKISSLVANVKTSILCRVCSSMSIITLVYAEKSEQRDVNYYSFFACNFEKVNKVHNTVFVYEMI